MADEPANDVVASPVKNAPMTLAPGDLPSRAMALVARNLVLAEHLQLAIADGIKKKHFSFGPDAAAALNAVLKSNDMLLKTHQLFEARSTENQQDAKRIDPETARAIAAKLSRALDGPGPFVDLEPDQPALPVPTTDPANPPGISDRLRAALDSQPADDNGAARDRADLAAAASAKLRKAALADAQRDPADVAAVKAAKADGKPARDALAELRSPISRRYTRESAP
jgi:hypothetical protein